MRRQLARWCAILCLAAPSAWAFDHQHAAWNGLLQRHVAWLPGGHASSVSYTGFGRDRSALKAYLDSLGAVSQAEFDAWPRAQRLAFLINAYNAYTVELILTQYPDLRSIRDLGSVLRSPWKRRFFTLLGKPRSLDDIEHGMIRTRGRYDDPRIHMAVNCASIGCPALRPDAYVEQRLEQQLEDQVVRFLSDPTRNRYNVQAGVLEVSKIFDWYGEDFAAGFRGATSVASYLAQYAKQLANDPESERRVREAKAAVKYLDYDWNLNDRKY